VNARIDNSVTDSRFMLWIDGVGGFLMCEGRTVTLGQAGGGSPVEVPLMADVSRRHATIIRDGEHYLLDPLRACSVDGLAVAERTRLYADADVELGPVRMHFNVPHVCGVTARINVVSGHRLRPHADGVVLLADACVVGPSPASHITAPPAARSCVLFRRPDGTIVFRTAGSYDVDGRRASETSVVTRSSRITADGLRWQLEPLNSWHTRGDEPRG